MELSKCRLLNYINFLFISQKMIVCLSIVDTLLNLRRTTNNSTAMNNQNKNAGFNYIALLTEQEINEISYNPSGE